jgi:hypothetical protein
MTWYALWASRSRALWAGTGSSKSGIHPSMARLLVTIVDARR